MLMLLCFASSFINVLAKDNVFSINKYSEESFAFIMPSYNQKQKEDGVPNTQGETERYQHKIQ